MVQECSNYIEMTETKQECSQSLHGNLFALNLLAPRQAKRFSSLEVLESLQLCIQLYSQIFIVL